MNEIDRAIADDIIILCWLAIVIMGALMVAMVVDMYMAWKSRRRGP